MEIYDEMRRIFDIFSEILRKSWSNDWSNTVNYALGGIRTKVVNGFIDFKDKIRSKTDEDYNP